MQVHYEGYDDLARYDEVIDRLKSMNCDIEFYSHHSVGLVADNKRKARKIQRKLLELVDTGLILGVETNRS